MKSPAMCPPAEIADRTGVQDLLRRVEERYQRLFSAVKAYMYSVGFSHGEAVSTSHNVGCIPVTGYTPEDYAANPYLWIQMVHPEDRELVLRNAAKIGAGEQPPPLEHRILHRDGGIRWVRDTIVERRDELGHIVGYDGLVEDITARKLAERELWGKNAELLAARKIQERLLPSVPPSLPDFDIAGVSLPCEVSAGDYFDYLPMCNGYLGLVVADVAGHRFGSALLMASTQAHLRSLSKMHNSVVEILDFLNAVLLDDIEDSYFVTMFLARLNPRSRSFVYASAGHEPGYVLDASGNVKTRLESTGIPLGILPDLELLFGGPIVLAPGDIVLLLTDGVRDARSPSDRTFGLQQTLELVRAHRNESAAEIVQAITRSVQSFSCSRRLADDVTTMVIKVVSG